VRRLGSSAMDYRVRLAGLGDLRCEGGDTRDEFTGGSENRLRCSR